MAPAPSPQPNPTRDPLLVAGIVVAVTARLSHWLIADRVWEDALITLAHVRNAVEGLGLTHHRGEGPVHGFTSALSVLVPLVGEAVASGSGLFVMRVASLLAAAVSVTAGYAIARHLGVGRWGLAFVLAYLALDQLQIFYGMSGMETQVATAILLAGSLAVLRGNTLAAGLLAGLAILARPDFLMWAVLVGAWAALRGRSSFARVVGGSLAVAGPWVVFTTAYYGSPIPQTIVAKGLVSNALSASPIEWLTDRLGFALLAVLRSFIPFYEDGVAVGAPLPAGVLALVGIGLLAAGIRGAWRTRRVPDWWPTLAYVGAFLLYWIAVLPMGYFTWYQPPFLALFAILAGAGIGGLRHGGRSITPVVAVALSVAFAMHLPWSTALDRKTQVEIEDGVRRPTGEYLGTVVRSGEAVTAEPAGYLGYYSRAEMWDFPGLTSPTSLAAIRGLPPERRTLTELIAALHPAWLALRPHEWDALRASQPVTAACYAEQRMFGIPAPPVIDVMGFARWNQDHAFLILRRDSPCPG